jgi:hypothetical protein
VNYSVGKLRNYQRENTPEGIGDYWTITTTDDKGSNAVSGGIDEKNDERTTRYTKLY